MDNSNEQKSEAKIDTSVNENAQDKSTDEKNVNASRNEQSIENMMNSVNNLSDTKMKSTWWSMKDFNNCIEADRKLVINNTLEFWIHDEVLSTYSDYFADLLGKTFVLNSTNEITRIDMPYDSKFFEVLFWMYSRDSKRLRKAAKNFHDFLKMISLGIFLKLKPDFFEILLNKIAFQWKEEYFYDPLWSRKVFTFPVLEKVVEEMKTNNFTKTVGIIIY